MSKVRLVSNLILLVLFLIATTFGLIHLLARNDHYRLLNYAVWILSSIPFLLVAVNRHRLKGLWLIGPLSFIVLLSGLELGLRFGAYEHRYRKAGVGKGFDPHSLIFWIPRENDAPFHDPFDEHNLVEHAIKFRSGPVEVQKKADSYRVVTMGGSNAFGLGIENYEDTFTGVLEKKMRTSFPNREIEFISAGVQGYVLYQNLLLYKLYIKEHEPDLIILYANINDRKNPSGPYTYREHFKSKTGMDLSEFAGHKALPESKAPLLAFQDAMSRLKIYNSLTQNINRVRSKIPSGLESAGITRPVNSLSDYEKNLKDLILAVKSDGAQIILVHPFYYHAIEETTEPNQRYRNLGKIMKTASAGKGVYFIDIHSAFIENYKAESLVFLPDDPGHINKTGHLLVAEMLAGLIEENAILGSKAAPQIQ